jgi:hypothetical protein
VSALVIGGVDVVGPPEVPTLTFKADGQWRFTSQGRRVRATELVVHETVTRSVASTIAVLRQRGLSVHLILGPDGEMSQHGDFADVLWHAGPGHNAQSVGIEVVNPYLVRLACPPWTRSIVAPWAVEGSYVLPTPAQAEAVTEFIDWAISEPPPLVEIPNRWPGLVRGAMQLGRVPAAAGRCDGVLAHQYFGHADGSWLVLYAWLRLEAGLDAPTAYEEAARRATGVATAADVSDLQHST